jgi:cyclase
VRTIEDAQRLLGAGSDKIAINTAAVEHPEVISSLAARFGSQAVVVAIDARRVRESKMETGNSKLETRPPASSFQFPVSSAAQGATRWEVVTYGGSRPTGLDALEWARRAAALGAGEFMLTSMDADGTQAGFDCELTATISRAVPIPVIASGGAGNPEHFAEVFLHGAADAALAASIFHFETHTVRSLKQFLRERGVPVRI